jgi:hypothetical protein
MRSFYKIFLIVCLMATGVFAQNLSPSQRSAGDIEAVVWLKPHHFGDAPEGYNFIMQNAGGGIRYYLWTGGEDKSEVFADLNKFCSSGTMGSATTLRMAYQQRVMSAGQGKVFIGVAGELIHYYNTIAIKSHVTAGLNPIVTLRYKRLSFSAAYSFPFGESGEKYPAMITGNVSFRF